MDPLHGFFALMGLANGYCVGRVLLGAMDRPRPARRCPVRIEIWTGSRSSYGAPYLVSEGYVRKFGRESCTRAVAREMGISEAELRASLRWSYSGLTDTWQRIEGAGAVSIFAN